MTPVDAPPAWYKTVGLRPLPFQVEVARRIAAGESGLLHSSTGSGKTFAVWLAIIERLQVKKGTQALWITPLRALAEDTLLALKRPLEATSAEWRVAIRTGDTSTSERTKQAKNAPTALVTTPESLSLMLATADADERLAKVEFVVVDEWHELLSGKRGTLVELALARLRALNPNLQVWGLSATLGDMALAAEVLGVSEVVSGEQEKEIRVRSLLPARPHRFPWAGHLGTAMMPLVAAELETSRSALIFCNTRAQAELWYQNLQLLLPDLGPGLALHHGSLDRGERERVERGLSSGDIRAVVTTSTLDLGVDFSPVERVFQIGSSKGVSRLIQRAGRSGHQPGAPSEIVVVPTNTLELVDIAALRVGIETRHIEAVRPPRLPLDVLVQHMVTLAVGPGFRADDLLREVRQTHAFRDLPEALWDWCLTFVTKGGACLKAYPQFHKVTVADGVYRVMDRRIAMRHRMSIGTIASGASVSVQFLKGGRLGHLEESFVSRLKKGDKFAFGGHVLEFVQMRDMVAYVRRTTNQRGHIVRWAGSQMSLSFELAHEIRRQLDEVANGEFNSPELEAARAMLTTQNTTSLVPAAHQLLVETMSSREGFHLFCYPVVGRKLHEGLAALIAYRMGQVRPRTIAISANDYGFELLSDEPLDDFAAHLVDSADLATEMMAAVNSSELARRRFRDVARVAGLIFSGMPGAQKSTRQVQASAGLLYDVFREYEPSNPLLQQAMAEVLHEELRVDDMARVLQDLRARELKLVAIAKVTPFCFPLLVSRYRATMSSEKVDERIARLLKSVGEK